MFKISIEKEVNKVVEDFIKLKEYESYVSTNKIHYIEDMCVINDIFREDVFNEVIRELEKREEL